MTAFDPRPHATRLDRVSQGIARLEGRLAAAVERETSLVKSVALAKGRLNARTKVDEFLDRLQTEQGRKNVASFETLLTALSQEVLPGTSPIKLELTIERNLPSLDILSERPGGAREDVFEDQGGAMTNVVGAGLRLIAVVKSRTARFVALDEADCWIRPDRVPAFYRVLEDAAKRLGVQCLAISHHDVSTFDAAIRVSTIVGHPDAGVTVTDDGPPEWPDADAEGVRWIRLVDVQGYKDATLRLSPGVNALTGPNNHGKSTFARALRALFLGEARDSLVRHGSKSCTVEAGVAGGRTLRLVRQPRKNPVNLWSLHEPDGSVAVVDGARLETGGRTAPGWVGDMFGITQLPGLDVDVHIAHQKRPVFLLGDPPSRRASVLSVGQESDHIRRMIEIQRQRCARDMATVRDEEREIDQLRRLAAHLKGGESLSTDLASLRERLEDIETATGNLTVVEGAADALTDARTRLERARSAAEALAGAPAPDLMDSIVGRVRKSIDDEAVAGRLVSLLDAWSRADSRAVVLDGLPGAVPVLKRVDEAMIPVGVSLKSARVGLSKAMESADLLSGLPEGRPDLAPTEDHAGILASMGALKEALASARAAGGAIAKEEDALRTRIDGLLKETGGLCPACGSPVADAGSLLEGHAHP